MPTPTPPERLPGLKAALDGFKPDDLASQKTLADLYGVAPSRFSSMVKSRFPDFPAPQRQADKTNWFPARAAVASMIAYCEQSGRAATAARERATEVFTGVTAAKADAAEEAAAAAPPLSASEIRQMASAAALLWKLEKDKGNYVPKGEVRDSFRALGHMLVKGVNAIPHRIDPNGMLPAAQRQALDRACRELLGEIHAEVAKWSGADD